LACKPMCHKSRVNSQTRGELFFLPRDIVMDAKVEEVKERKKLENLLLVACERGLLDDARRLVHLSGVHRFELVRDKRGRTPMHLAAARGRRAVLEFLWSKAADMDTEDDDGRTPLHLAAANGHVECVRLLVDKGEAFMDGTEGIHGFAAVEMAACRGQEDVVEALVGRGCSRGASAEALLRVEREGRRERRKETKNEERNQERNQEKDQERNQERDEERDEERGGGPDARAWRIFSWAIVAAIVAAIVGLLPGIFASFLSS